MCSSRISQTVRRRIDYRPGFTRGESVQHKEIDAVEESSRRSARVFAVDSFAAVSATARTQHVDRVWNTLKDALSSVSVDLANTPTCR
jgi:hypothetical protein